MATAALWAGWDRTAPRFAPGPLAPKTGSSAPTGVAFLQNHLNAGSLVSVQAAFGFDVNSDSQVWDWRDITSDVLQTDGGIQLVHGRSDEQSKSSAAECTLLLDNQLGRYSYGEQSPNWPHVRKNVPIRVQTVLQVETLYPALDLFPSPNLYPQGIDEALGPITLFQGYASSWTPVWDTSGNYAAVQLNASGILRRLDKNNATTKSVMRTTVLTDDDVIAYWPFEDKKNAQSVASAIDGVSPIKYWGEPNFEASDVFDASDTLPELHNARFTGYPPDYDNTNQEFNFRFFLAFPDENLAPDATPVDYVIAQFMTTGTLRYIYVTYRWDGVDSGLIIQAYNKRFSLIDETPFAANLGGLNGKKVRVTGFASQDGNDVDVGILMVEQGSPFTNDIDSYIEFQGFLATNRTIGQVRRVRINEDKDVDKVVFGHLSIEKKLTTTREDWDGVNAFRGETATERMTRLAAEHSLPLTVIGDSDVRMGPQKIGKVLDLIRECETADQGLLTDGYGPGLTYITRTEREGQTPALTLDANAGDIPLTFEPRDDDIRLVNQVTAKRQGGSSATIVYDIPRVGVTAAGIYDEEIEVNIEDDRLLSYYAGLLARGGTIQGYRYPNLTLFLHKTPEMIESWLALVLGNPIAIENIEDARSQHPDGTLKLTVEGVTQTIAQMQWELTLNLSLYEALNTGIVAEDVGDIDERVIHLDSDGSLLVYAAEVGATTLTVSTPSGPIWTTDTDDFPLSIYADQRRVEVTAISGGSSPQTFTVEPLEYRLAEDTGVFMWSEPRVGL